MERIKFRDYEPEDAAFIYDTWLNGLRGGNDLFKEIEINRYYRYYRSVIKFLMERYEVTKKIACLEEDEDVLLGYSITEGDTLHWIYVKPHWRKFGIGNNLLPDKIKKVTHLTNMGKSILKKKYPDAIFDPFIT